MPIAEFAAAIRLGNRTQEETVENDEVECLLANMIYKVRSATPPTALYHEMPQACLLCLKAIGYTCLRLENIER